MDLDTEESLDHFIAAFEDGTWPISEWKHVHHLAMAACYIVMFGKDEALRRARVNIARYNEAQGGENTDHSGYHETLTVFWIDAVARTLPSGGTRLETVQHVVNVLAPQRDLWREFYSFDVVKSREARLKYIPPDRSALAAP